MSTSLILPRRQILSSEDHATTLHGQGRGTVAIARRPNGRWIEHTVSLSDIGYVTSQLAGEPDVYLSQNRFWGRRRAIASLAQLDALFIDLDYYSVAPALNHLRPEHVLRVAFERLEEHRIPGPPFAVSTGRGIAMVWMHSAVPRCALSRWQACQRAIYQALQQLGADARALDAARVLRLIGTQNSKSKTLVMPLTDVGQVWDFDVLADEILPLKRAELERLRAERENARARRRQVPDISRLAGFNFVTLAEGRLTDLQRLRDYRFMGELPSGQRDEWMFCAAVNMAYLTSANTLPRELAALADEAAGWTERETRARMSAVQQRAKLAALGERATYGGRNVDPRYRLRNATIIARLRITETEMLGARLHHLVSDDIRRERERARSERRRRAAGAVDRQTYEANSLSQQRPWEAEGVGRRTWEQHRKARNTPATASCASPTGCMVVKPPERELRQAEPLVEPELLRYSLPKQQLQCRIPATFPVQLELALFGSVPPVEHLLTDPRVVQWQEAGGRPPPEIWTVMREMARRGFPQRKIATRAAWSSPHLSNVARGRFGASPVRAKALVETLRDLAAA